MFRKIVFTAQQPVRSFGSSTDHDIRLVHAHAREDFHAMIAFCVNISSLRTHKIFCTQYMYILHRGNTVGIMETDIDHCYGHALSLETGFMQQMSVAHLNLPSGRTINAIRPDRFIFQ